MNKIFKVIWSKTKNCYVVTSELAKSHTKAPSKKGISRVLVCGVLACVLSGSFVMPVANAYFTQYPGDISVINIDDQYFNPDTDNNTALEWDLGRSDNGNIEYSIGVHSYALKIGNVLTGEAGLADATDIYDNMHVSNGNFINANNSVAQNLTALDNAIAGISGSSLINNSSAYLSDGYFALADTNGVYFADISGDLNDALNELYYASEFEEGDQYSGLIQNNSIGFKALKDKNGNVIFKGGINYRSFGNLPDAMKTVTLSGEKAVEFGIVTQAELDTLKAKGNIDFAVEGGYASQAVGYGSTALGIGATALGDGNIAIGNNAGAVLGKTVGGINNGFNYVIAEPDQMAVSDKVNNISIGKDSFADGNNGIAIGTRSWAVSDDSVAIGRGAVGNAGSIAIGKNSYSVKSGNIALGDGALADSGNSSILLSGDDQPVHGNVALGADSVAPDDDNNVVSVGAAVGDKVVSEISGNVKTVTADKAFTRRIINVSEGIDDSDAVTVSQLNTAIAGISGGSEIHGIGINGITASDANYNGGGATGSRSIAIGNEVEANGMSSIAIGDVVSFHDNAKSAIGIGNSVESSWQSVVIGSNSTSRESETVVLGYYNTTDANSSVVIGDENYVGTDSDYSVAIGHNVVIGDTANGSENLENVVAIGNGVTVKDDSYNTIAIGNSAVENDAFGSIALNGNIFENSHSGVAINGNIGENSVGSIAINGQIQDNVTSSIAIGGSVSEDVSNSVALGSGSAATEDNVVSIGNNVLKRKIKYVAAGVDDTDAVNVSQLNDAIAGVGSGGTHYLGINTTSTTDANYNGETAVGLNSISIGRAGFDAGTTDKVAGALKENSISIGNGTTAGGVSAIAIGTGAIGGKNSSVAKDYSIAIGRDAKASIDRYATPVWTSGSGTPLASNKKGSAIALGSEAEAENMNSIAIGYDTSSKGTNSIMIGMTGRANGADSIGIGTSVQADASNSVSIGANSASRTSGGVSIGSGAINNGGVAIGNEAYAGSVGVVSFGHKAGDPAKSGTYSSAKTVRVINVADGVETHDVSTVEQTGSALELTGSTLKLKSIVGDLSQVDLSNLTGSTYTAGNHISIGNDNSIAAVVDGTVSSGNTGLVNGGQVYDALQTIRPNVYIAGNGIVINGDDNSVSVKNVIMYDSDSQDTATLNGTRGTKLTNLKVGSLVNGSTDAVVGHQLWQTNENIRGFAQDIQTNSTNISNLTTSVTNALSSVSAISTTVDAINNVKADASLNNLTDTGRQVIATAAANAVQEYMAANGSNDDLTGNGLLGTTNSLSTPRAMGFGLMANPMSNDNDNIVTNNDDLNDNSDNTISQAVQDALDTKVEISDFNTALDLKADKDSVYSKDEVDIKFNTKADISYVDNQLGSKADLSYVGAEFEKKADKDSVYTKDEADILLDAKADKEMLDAKADKNASNIEVEDWAKVLGIGEVTEGNTNLVNGGTVYNALQNVKGNDLMTVDNNAIRIGGNAKYDDVRMIDVSTASGEGRVITGVVVNPEDATSVANVGYVNAIGENIIAGVTEGFRRVDDKISDVGANAAAMSALMPAGDDADKKWSLSASVGHYDSSTAGAVGLFYKPSDNVILNVRGTVGSDENMLAGGVSVALDKGTVPGVSKAQLVRTVNAQAQRIEQLEEKDKQRDMEMEQLRREVLMMKQQNIKK